MRRANKQNIPASTFLVYRHKKWTNPRPTFKVLAGNLNAENRKTPTISVGVTTILTLCSFHLQVSERFE